jgi:GT2 family glycosyltransferase
MIVSVIVVSFNGRPYLHDCLNSVLDQQEMSQSSYEVILVDSHSTDGSATYVENTFPTVQVIRLDRNYGYYEAFNRVAASVALGKYLIPLPQDTILHRKCLAELVKAADKNEQALVCLVNSVDPTAPDYAKKEREGWPQYVYLLSTTRLGQTHPKRWPFSPDTVQVLTYSGVSALMKRDVLTKTGRYFDSELNHFIGDMDLGLRVNVAGYKVILVPTAVVYHIEDNKNWSDMRLLWRALLGARDRIVAYYQNMYGLEFLLFLPFLLLGLPLKAYALRSGFVQRTLLFVIALPMTPLAFLLAVPFFAKNADKKEDVLSRRRTDRFWLLRTVLTGGPK